MFREKILRKGVTLIMNYRHELKHEINFADMLAVRQRLRAVADVDKNAVNGKYQVRSLYFDDPMDTALREKLDGVNRREKFRLRFYNGDISLIRLEKKYKCGGLCLKQGAELTAAEAEAILNGEYGWMRECGDPPVRELYSKLSSRLLRPKTIVEYTREPFVYAPGNVRITLDSDIRTCPGTDGFLDPDCTVVPAAGAAIILEIKWDAFLPDIIRDAVQLGNRHTSAYSKYAACRIYG